MIKVTRGTCVLVACSLFSVDTISLFLWLGQKEKGCPSGDVLWVYVELLGERGGRTVLS